MPGMTSLERREDRFTVIVAPRDTFTRLEDCLRNVLRHTRSPIDIICLAGGAPLSIQGKLRQLFGDQVRFIFLEGFRTDAQLRNIGLREAKTELAACLDSDVFVRPGWFEPLVDCQRETGASLVTPIVLDRQNLIHTAGNSFYITEERGKKYGVAELRYANVPFRGTTNISRQETDFAEVHCHFVEVETALALGIYDENLREGHDFDSGLTLKKAGKKQVVEPLSLVYLHYPRIQDRLEDIPLYLWKWDLKAVIEGFGYLERKWGIDMMTHSGMREHVVRLNHRVGFCTLMKPSKSALAVDLFYFKIKDRVSHSKGFWRGVKNRWLGYSR